MKRNTLVLTATAGIVYLFINSFTVAPSRIGHVAVSGCGGGSCHGSSSAATVVGINLSKDGIPVTNNKYTPGTKYKVTITGTNSSFSRWGFQVSATTGSNTMAGTFSSIPDSTQIGTAAGLKLVEHTNPILRTNGMSISFDWTAPVTGTGNVKLSAAVNAVNFNQNSSGDAFNTNQLTLSEASTEVEEVTSKSVSIYPNPATDILYIHQSIINNAFAISIYNQQGAIVKQQNLLASSTTSVDIASLPTGIYYLQINNTTASAMKAFVKQ